MRLPEDITPCLPKWLRDIYKLWPDTSDEEKAFIYQQVSYLEKEKQRQREFEHAIEVARAEKRCQENTGRRCEGTQCNPPINL